MTTLTSSRPVAFSVRTTPFFGRAVAERPVVSPHFGANQRKASIEKPEIDRFLENPAILVLPVQVHSDTGFNLFA
ncbi:MAG: hypothetical protein IPK79_02325 [Vampirovibrionales bacterium]|nr:hypothetical protein [Vampirovibrionales bacterium]